MSGRRERVLWGLEAEKVEGGCWVRGIEGRWTGIERRFESRNILSPGAGKVAIQLGVFGRVLLPAAWMNE